MTGPESAASRALRDAFNAHAAYAGTGARVESISGDLRRAQIEVALSEATRNLQGTVFGGSIYGAVDPVHEVLLIHLLGPRYVVWSKAATVRFLRPARTTLRAAVEITGDELAAVVEAVARDGRTDRRYRVELVDEAGTVCAEVEKVVFVGRADPA